MREITHFIDGVSVAGTSGRYGDVFNPNTGDVQARVALATAAELTQPSNRRCAPSRPGARSTRSAAPG